MRYDGVGRLFPAIGKLRIPVLWIAGAILLAAVIPASAFDHSHASWGRLLQKHVIVHEQGKASRVRYAGMAQDRAALKGYLATLSAVPESEFRAWTREQQMAFLVNAYNAFTVEKVLTRYPDIRSIWDFGKLFGNPFKDRFFTLLGRQASLDIIENELLRPVYKDSRVHYAINCASIGCPMLREEAYVAPLLADDPQQRKLIADGKAPLVFLNYDWSLNDAPSH